MAVLLTPTYIQVEDNNGLPIPGAQIFTYAAGTLTPKAAYTDASGTVSLPNPIIADSAGRFTAWIDGSYKIIIKDASGVTISTQDNITSFQASSAAAASVTNLPYKSQVLSGLWINNNGADSANDLDINPGSGTDLNGNIYILSSILTKRLDASFASGTGNGGLFTGTKAPNTTYHIWLIRNNTTGNIDAGYDVSAAGLNVPSGWTGILRIASMYTDGSSNWVGFKQKYDTFMLNKPPSLVSYTNNTSPTLVNLKVPTGIVVYGIFNALAFSSPSVTNALGAFYATNQSPPDSYIDVSSFNNGTYQYGTSSEFKRFTDVNGNLFYVASFTSGASVSVVTKGWVDFRGKDN